VRPTREHFKPRSPACAQFSNGLKVRNKFIIRETGQRD
jgi:hypothetical protein